MSESSSNETLTLIAPKPKHVYPGMLILVLLFFFTLLLVGCGTMSFMSTSRRGFAQYKGAETFQDDGKFWLNEGISMLCYSHLDMCNGIDTHLANATSYNGLPNYVWFPEIPGEDVRYGSMIGLQSIVLPPMIEEINLIIWLKINVTGENAPETSLKLIWSGNDDGTSDINQTFIWTKENKTETYTPFPLKLYHNRWTYIWNISFEYYSESDPFFNNTDYINIFIGQIEMDVVYRILSNHPY